MRSAISLALNDVLSPEQRRMRSLQQSIQASDVTIESISATDQGQGLDVDFSIQLSDGASVNDGTSLADALQTAATNGQLGTRLRSMPSLASVVSGAVTVKRASIGAAQSPSPSPAATEPQEEPSNVGALVGGVVGALVVLGVVAWLARAWHIRRATEKRRLVHKPGSAEDREPPMATRLHPGRWRRR